MLTSKNSRGPLMTRWLRALAITGSVTATMLLPIRADAVAAHASGLGSGVIRAFPVPFHQAFGITAGPGGTWYSLASSVERIRDGRTRTFPVPDPVTASVGWLTWPGHGPVWFADRGNARLGTVSSTGTVHEYQIPAGPDGAAVPQSIVLGPHHQVWFTDDSNSRIGTLNTATGTFTFADLPTPDGSAVGMILGHDGDLYAVERSVDKIARLDPRTGLFTEWTLTTGAFPNRLAADTHGNVWFTELDTNTLGRIGPDGHLTQLPLPGGPVGLTFSNGRLYAALYIQGAVAQISTNGTVLHEWTMPNPTAAGPLQVAVSHGYVWATGNNDVYRIDPRRLA